MTRSNIWEPWELPVTSSLSDLRNAKPKISGLQTTNWLDHWVRTYKLPALSLRLFNVYGPRSRTNGADGVFGVFLAQKIHGRPFTVVGDGR